MTNTQSLSDFNSMWQWTKSRSNYHFNKWQIDNPDNFFKVIDQLENTWAADLETIKKQSFATTWKTITYTGGQQQKGLADDKRSYDLSLGGADIDLVELTNVFDNFDNLPNLQKVIDYFALDRVQPRCHVQLTGQMFTMHIDPLNRLFTNSTVDYDKVNEYNINDIVRITVMLQDWEPGQFIIFGNYNYQQWHAGDFFIHDWMNTPHATANASEHVRITLQLTGLRTKRTNDIIGGPDIFNPYFKQGIL